VTSTGCPTADTRSVTSRALNRVPAGTPRAAEGGTAAGPGCATPGRGPRSMPMPVTAPGARSGPSQVLTLVAQASSAPGRWEQGEQGRAPARSAAGCQRALKQPVARSSPQHDLGVTGGSGRRHRFRRCARRHQTRNRPRGPFPPDAGAENDARDGCHTKDRWQTLGRGERATSVLVRPPSALAGSRPGSELKLDE